MVKEKTCYSYHKDKDFSCFGKNKNNSDGLQRECIFCRKLAYTSYTRTREGVISSIYGSQKLHSKRRSMPQPNYSKKEFYEWAVSQINFDALYLNWINSGYSSMKKPSRNTKSHRLQE